jgi:hypothetical protein
MTEHPGQDRVRLVDSSTERNHMRHRLIATGVSLGLALMGTQLLAPTAQAAHPVARAAAPTIKAKVTDKAIKLSTSSIHAGLVTFKVVDKKAKGSAVLQAFHLHPGYTLQQLSQDFGPAFSGDTAAIARLDDNVDWLAGAEAKSTKPGWFQERLTKGSYVFIDQNQQAPIFTVLTVRGKVHKRTPVATHGKINIFTYGFEPRGAIRNNGWVKVDNRSDQPHFIELQRVKSGTTRGQVLKFLRSGGQGQPSFAKRANSSFGVISPNRHAAWNLDLPKGRYALMCFWPDRATGMPHAVMGMVDMVNLK